MAKDPEESKSEHEGEEHVDEDSEAQETGAEENKR